LFIFKRVEIEAYFFFLDLWFFGMFPQLSQRVTSPVSGALKHHFEILFFFVSQSAKCKYRPGLKASGIKCINELKSQPEACP
jgi:hypothetical protein